MSNTDFEDEEDVASWYDEEVHHHIGIERIKSRVVNIIVNQVLKKVEKAIAKKVVELAENTARRTLRAIIAERKLAGVREAMKEGYDVLNKRLEKEVLNVAHYESEWQQDKITYMIGKGMMNKPTAEQLEAAVLSDPFQGRILKDWGRELSLNAYNRVKDQITIGWLSGESVDEIVTRLRGTQAANYRDGVLAISRRGAEALVRTALNHSENAAKMVFIKKNAHLFSGVRWTSVLDNRTTPVCRALDGQVFPVDYGPRPPAHWGCRSMIVPVIKGDNNPPRETYQQWLARQPIAIQDDILGPTRGKLFREGGVTLDRFVDFTGKQYTINDLRRLEFKAFERIDRFFGLSVGDVQPGLAREEWTLHNDVKLDDPKDVHYVLYNKQDNAWVKVAPKAEAVKEYVEYNLAGRANQALRDGKVVDLKKNDKLSETEASYVKTLSDLIKEKRLEHNVELYRGVNATRKNTLFKQLEALKPGDTFTDYGFMSTSTTPEVMKAFAVTFDEKQRASTEIVIRAFKGDEALVLPVKMTGATVGNEYEVLFQRGTNFKFIRRDGNKFYFETRGVKTVDVVLEAVAPSIEQEFVTYAGDKSPWRKLFSNPLDNEAREHVLNEGNKTKTEHLAWYQENKDKKLSTFTTGQEKRVTFDEDTIRAFREGKDVITHHNHPWDVSFSRSDYDAAKLDGVKRMVVHIGNGSTYEMEWTPEFRVADKKKPSLLYDALSAAYRPADDDVRMVTRQLGTDYIDREWRIKPHATAEFLQDAGIIKYDAKMEPSLESWMKPALERLKKNNIWTEKVEEVKKMLK